jgi:hypothetical protein
LLLPAGPDGRHRFDDACGNRHHKLDLEAVVALPDGRLIAFGSGSTPVRERIVILEDQGVRVRDAAQLYSALRSEVAFSGAELNLEGAVISGEMMRLFQRGNGTTSVGLEPVNAVGSLPLDSFLRWLDGGGPVPPLVQITQVELGLKDGTRFGFTDATARPDGSIVFLAAAEESPSAVADGAVLGSLLGILDGDGAQLLPIVDDSGSGCALKLEGIQVRANDPSTFDVVADGDRSDEPALGAELRLRFGTRR